MTSYQLIEKLNNTFGIGQWPRSYEVDHETYANCCQAVFNYLVERGNAQNYPCLEGNKEAVALGPNNGLMFKNVELLLEQ